MFFCSKVDPGRRMNPQKGDGMNLIADQIQLIDDGIPDHKSITN